MELSSASPATLGKYQIRGVLGRGAMGTVYDGWDPVIGRRVAIKTVRLLGDADPEVQEGLERFKREAQAAGRLTHPNIVGVYDYGETDETAYIVMEFVEGPSLKDLLDARERFPIEETARIMDQVLAGLQFSHEHGVVHRDIKPGNVMLAKGGRVKLADFGIARIESSVMTQDGTMLGTPAYMSPEQLMAQTVDARSDIYSAGVMLYQLLTGERPFEGGLTAIIHKALNTVPPRPSEIAVTAPPNLDPVVARAMSKRPADRYPSADSFAQALRTAIADPTSVEAAPVRDDDATFIARPDEATFVARPPAAPPPAPPPPAPPPPVAPPAAPPAQVAPAGPPMQPEAGSNKALLGGIAAVVLLGLGVGGWFLMRPSSQPVSPQAAIQESRTAAPPVASQPTPAPKPAAEAPANPPPPKPVAEAPTPSPTPSPQAPATPAPPAQPSVAQPSVAQPSVAQPSVAQPSVAQPSVTQPSVTQPPAVPAPVAQTPAASPPASAAPPPAEVAGIVPPNPASIRDALAGLALSANCAIPRFSVADDGGISAAGLVGTGAPATALRSAVDRAVGGAQLSWLMVPVDGPYCEAFNLVRPIAQATSPAFGLTLKDDITRLRDNDPIRPILKLPDFPAYLQVDYLSHDGSVLHVLTSQGGKGKAYAAGTTLALGDPKDGIGTVGPPFGTDVILAVASSAPLWAKPRPAETETAQDYLPALQAAVDAARRGNAKVTGRVLVLDTMAR
jgi:serine/threonine-protein kinase